MDSECTVIGDLHVTIRGDGPPVLLIHGFGASSFTWSKIVSSLASHYTTIALDLKGFGKSRKPRDGHYTLRDQAAAVRKVIDTLGLTGLTVIGHSMGGGVALLVTIDLEKETPGRLRRLVLIDSQALPQRLPLFLRVLRVPVLGPVIVRIVPPTWAVRYILSVVYFDPDKIEQSFVEEYAAPLRHSDGRAALIAAARAIIPPDADQLVAQYQTIQTPVLLLWGRQDRIVPFDLAAQLKSRIPTASLRDIDQCGHAPQEEWPDLTLAALGEFLGDGRP
jgi:pimeloyl-ACP methyl ester carboxylesterase